MLDDDAYSSRFAATLIVCLMPLPALLRDTPLIARYDIDIDITMPRYAMSVMFDCRR